MEWPGFFSQTFFKKQNFCNHPSCGITVYSGFFWRNNRAILVWTSTLPPRDFLTETAESHRAAVFARRYSASLLFYAPRQP